MTDYEHWYAVAKANGLNDDEAAQFAYDLNRD